MWQCGQKFTVIKGGPKFEEALDGAACGIIASLAEDM
jgi:hypothetical protein